MLLQYLEMNVKLPTGNSEEPKKYNTKIYSSYFEVMPLNKIRKRKY